MESSMGLVDVMSISNSVSDEDRTDEEAVDVKKTSELLQGMDVAIGNNDAKGPLCQSCGEKLALYRCPRCLFRSCSLRCCKEHKVKGGCNGVRDRTQFKTIQEFRDQDLYSDYFFLEEVGRSADVANRRLRKEFGGITKPRDIHSKRRDRGKNRSGRKRGRDEMSTHGKMEEDSKRGKAEQTGFEHGTEDLLSSGKEHGMDAALSTGLPLRDKSILPQHLRVLAEEAGRRGVDLHFMPFGMGRRKNNTTYFHYKKKTLEWKVELHFVHESEKVPIVENRVNDGICLMDLLKKYLAVSQDNALVRRKLDAFTQSPIEDLKIVMQRVFTPSNTPSYYYLNLSKTLRDNLSGTSIIENPVFIILSPEAANKRRYPVAHKSIEEVER